MTDADKATDDESVFASARDIEPNVIRKLAEAADALMAASRLTRWGYVQDHCRNALDEIRKAITEACGHEERCG